MVTLQFLNAAFFCHGKHHFGHCPGDLEAPDLQPLMYGPDLHSLTYHPSPMAPDLWPLTYGP